MTDSSPTNPRRPIGTSFIPDFVDIRFPGSLVAVMQELASVLLIDNELGVWTRKDGALDVMKAFVAARRLQQNPGADSPTEMEDEDMIKEADRLLNRVVESYNEYVRQPIKDNESPVAWVP